MGGIASIDGVITAIEDARVPVLDRGFLYGDGAFEALRTYGGVPHALHEHLERLFRSCAILGIDAGISAQGLAEEIRTAIAHCDAKERYVRIILTRGQGPFGLSPRGAGPSLRVLLVRPIADESGQSQQHPIRVESVTVPPSRFSAGAKPSSYLTNLLALEHAQRFGADDAFLLGEYGELLEGATSSVFLVRAGQILTPTLALGILPGITRDRVVALSRREGWVVRECLLTIHDAYRADEVFATSSIREIVPVVAVDGVSIRGGEPGPVSQHLMAAYRADARGA